MTQNDLCLSPKKEEKDPKSDTMIGYAILLSRPSVLLSSPSVRFMRRSFRSEADRKDSSSSSSFRSKPRQVSINQSSSDANIAAATDDDDGDNAIEVEFIRPGAIRVCGIEASSLDDDDVDSILWNWCETNHYNKASPLTPPLSPPLSSSSSSWQDDEQIVQAELAPDLSHIISENQVLKQRLRQLEREHEELRSQLFTAETVSATVAVPLHGEVRRQKTTLVDASRVVCEATDDILLVFSIREPKDAKAGIASGLKNVTKGAAAGIVASLGEFVQASQTRTVTDATKGISKGVVKLAAYPIAGTMLGFYQIGRGVRNSMARRPHRSQT